MGNRYQGSAEEKLERRGLVKSCQLSGFRHTIHPVMDEKVGNFHLN